MAQTFQETNTYLATMLITHLSERYVQVLEQFDKLWGSACHKHVRNVVEWQSKGSHSGADLTVSLTQRGWVSRNPERPSESQFRSAYP